MDKTTLTIKKAALTKALLYGHIMNIFLGVIVFGVVHIVFKLGNAYAVPATIFTTLFMSFIIAVLGTKKVTRPLEEISGEIHELHQKVSTSTTELIEVNNATNALLNNMPVGFLVFNSKSELTRGNSQAAKLLGLEEPELLNAEQVFTIVKTLKSSNKPINFVDWLHEVRAGKINATKHWSFVVTKNGDTPVVCDILAYYNKQDSHDYELVVVLIDRSEEYMRQEKQMEFISLAAHELRGPITVMRGLIDILSSELQTSLSQEHKELLTRMAVSSRQLAGYVDNILNVSRIDKDTFEVQPREADWSQLVTQACSELGARAKANHRILEAVIPKKVPTVAVDPTAIMHVLSNLIDNAIKYSTENGKVVVSIKTKDNQVETTVQDFGIGIPANVVDNLFVKFYRSHRSKQIVSGTGLGLFLCKAIVEAHGGTIWVRSTEGAGTTFGFTLPTYESVADKLKSGNAENGIIRGSHGWIKNHALYRR